MAIKQKIKNLLLKLIPESLKYEIYKPYLQAEISYSQEGEDLILKRLFAGKPSGFYVDVGAHHPTRFSNTYLFYLKGWRGINIDAMPGCMKLFNEIRPGDINVELGIGMQEGTSLYYIFNEPALNTFSIQEAKRRDNSNGYKITSRKKIKIIPLQKVLDENLPEGSLIDFFTIDVEGNDLEVLKSNNWIKYRPTYILVEDLQRMDINEIINNSELNKYLNQTNYILISKSLNTLIYKCIE